MSRLIDADALWMDIIHAMDYCDDILEIIEQQPTVDPEQKTGKWVPITERLPEKHGSYLVSAYDSDKKCLAVGISFFYPEINDFRSINAYEDYYWEVKAWMPLPAPYQEDNQ